MRREIKTVCSVSPRFWVHLAISSGLLLRCYLASYPKVQRSSSTLLQWASLLRFLWLPFWSKTSFYTHFIKDNELFQQSFSRLWWFILLPLCLFLFSATCSTWRNAAADMQFAKSCMSLEKIYFRININIDIWHTHTARQPDSQTDTDTYTYTYAYTFTYTDTYT